MNNRTSYYYLMPDYSSISEFINFIHGSSYKGSKIKYIHHGKTSSYTKIKIKVEQIIGKCTIWFIGKKPEFTGNLKASYAFKYLTPNYTTIAHYINSLHCSNYNNRQLKHIHAGKHKRTERSIKLEIDSIVGEYQIWFDEDDNKRYRKVQ